MNRIAYKPSFVGDGWPGFHLPVGVCRCIEQRLRKFVCTSPQLRILQVRGGGKTSIDGLCLVCFVPCSGEKWGGPSPTFPTARPGPLAVSAPTRVNKTALLLRDPFGRSRRTLHVEPLLRCMIHPCGIKCCASRGPDEYIPN
jgi:hypothetical protein